MGDQFVDFLINEWQDNSDRLGISIINLLVPTSLGSMCLWPEDSQHFLPWVGVWAPAEQLKILIRLLYPFRRNENYATLLF